MTGRAVQYDLRRHADGQTVTVTVTGEWDGYTGEPVVTELRALLGQGYRNVVVDASNLTFWDSTVLGRLVGLHQQAQAAGGWLRIVAPRPAVRRPLQLSGLDQVLDVTDDPGAA